VDFLMARNQKKLDGVPQITGTELDHELRTDVWPEFKIPLPLASVFKIVQRPAPRRDIGALLAAFGGSLPASYLDFLTESNGAEYRASDEGGECLALWSAGEISGLNEAYAIPRYLPEFLAIGSDGGDDAIGFDRIASPDPEKWPVVRIGFGKLDRADFRTLSPGFREWRQHGFPLRYYGWCCGGG
jgi:hypothetical protein